MQEHLTPQSMNGHTQLEEVRLPIQYVASAIESLLFVAGRPLEHAELRKLLNIDDARLDSSLGNPGCGFLSPARHASADRSHSRREQRSCPGQPDTARAGGRGRTGTDGRATRAVRHYRRVLAAVRPDTPGTAAKG